jgi:large subunit ribosomal protein L4
MLSRSTLSLCRSFSSTSRICSERELFRYDHRNQFVSIPQTWVSTLEDLESPPTEIINLHPEVFRAAPRIDLLHRNIVWQENYKNLQLTKQLSRAEMPGGGRKPWPQKKMGRHHAGSIRSPHFHAGGFAHGVRGPKTWFYMLPISIRLRGLCTALSIKHAQNDLVIVDNFNSLTSNDPQFLVDLSESRNWGYSVLFVDPNFEALTNLVDATEQLPSFNLLPVAGLNCFSILKHETLVLSKNAVDMLETNILKRLHSPISLRQKYQYKDYKQKILDESEHEEDPTYTPFI